MGKSLSARLKKKSAGVTFQDPALISKTRSGWSNPSEYPLEPWDQVQSRLYAPE
jgi:hypothetical protein